MFAATSAAGRVLLTFDLDFAGIRHYPPGTHPGIVVFRLSRTDGDSITAAVARLFVQHTETDIAGNLVIVEDRRIRIRRPPTP